MRKSLFPGSSPILRIFNIFSYNIHLVHSRGIYNYKSKKQTSSLLSFLYLSETTLALNSPSFQREWKVWDPLTLARGLSWRSTKKYQIWKYNYIDHFVILDISQDPSTLWVNVTSSTPVPPVVHQEGISTYRPTISGKFWTLGIFHLNFQVSLENTNIILFIYDW